MFRCDSFALICKFRLWRCSLIRLAWKLARMPLEKAATVDTRMIIIIANFMVWLRRVVGCDCILAEWNTSYISQTRRCYANIDATIIHFGCNRTIYDIIWMYRTTFLWYNIYATCKNIWLTIHGRIQMIQQYIFFSLIIIDRVLQAGNWNFERG